MQINHYRDNAKSYFNSNDRKDDNHHSFKNNVKFEWHIGQIITSPI